MRESFSAHPDNEERPRLSELIQSIDPVGRKTRIVAIDGHGGSGKSELARQLAGALGVGPEHVGSADRGLVAEG